MTRTILLVDDEEEIVELLRIFLEKENYAVREAGNGEEAWVLLQREHIDLALIDLMMPGMDGYQLISRIREKLRLPVIIVSAKTGDVDKVTGLGLGADDFIAKPFSPIEVVARIQAHLRRYYDLLGAQPVAEIKPARSICGSLQLDHESCMLYRENQSIVLGPLEYKLLNLFMNAPGRIYTKKQIYEAVWNEPYLEDSNTVMVQISRLRDKLEDDPKHPRYIRTIKGLGYKLVSQESGE
ncbi:response regulator transcription factor [Paenibacillus illinoisensis]|uniref:Response regulator transcription factor n=1 Tax=Paenibacillus illinoisensis TaxID=59845 RepID=A0ABW8HQZ7_9BACL